MLLGVVVLAATLSLLPLLAPPRARAAGIDDGANLFSPAALQVGAQRIQTIQQQTGINVDVVTMARFSGPGQDIDSAVAAYLAQRPPGTVVIYVVRDEHALAIGTKPGTPDRISAADQTETRDAMLAQFTEGAFDRGLLDGLARLEIAAVIAPAATSASGLNWPFVIFVAATAIVALALLRLLSQDGPGAPGWQAAGGGLAPRKPEADPAREQPGETEGATESMADEVEGH